MNYKEIVLELNDVVKESEESGVNIIKQLEELLSNTKDEKQFNKTLEIMSLIQEEDILRQKVERVLNSICKNQNIDCEKFNIAPTAKHISGDDYEEMSQEDIDKLFNS